jgi:hypothetical protein
MPDAVANTLTHCPYCNNLSFMVRIKFDNDTTAYRSIWDSCHCVDHAEEYEKVRNAYLQEEVHNEANQS